MFFQACTIDMALGSLDDSTVTLVPDVLTMTHAVDMPIFRITHWNLDKKTFRTGTHGTRTCIKRKKITYGKFFDFRAEKCI